MSNQPLFITDNLPTLGQIHPDQAKNMMELCKEMEGLIDQTNTHVSHMLKQQQNNILLAFKTVLENMKADIDKINKKFHEYVAYHESDSQIVNAQNKMVFFRQECHNLNEQCKSLKLSNTKLSKANQYLENELQFTKKALFNQVEKNQKLQDTIKQYKIQILQMCSFDSNANSNIKIHSIVEQKKNDEINEKLNIGPLTTNIRRARGFSSSKQNTLHQISYNSVDGTDLKSKYINSQQTRAGSLQKSLCPKQSAIFDYNVLETSIPPKQFYEYSLIQSLKYPGE